MGNKKDKFTLKGIIDLTKNSKVYKEKMKKLKKEQDEASKSIDKHSKEIIEYIKQKITDAANRGESSVVFNFDSYKEASPDFDTLSTYIINMTIVTVMNYFDKQNFFVRNNAIEKFDYEIFIKWL